MAGRGYPNQLHVVVFDPTDITLFPRFDRLMSISIGEKPVFQYLQRICTTDTQLMSCAQAIQSYPENDATLKQFRDAATVFQSIAKALGLGGNRQQMSLAQFLTPPDRSKMYHEIMRQNRHYPQKAAMFQVDERGILAVQMQYIQALHPELITMDVCVPAQQAKVLAEFYQSRQELIPQKLTLNIHKIAGVNQLLSSITGRGQPVDPTPYVQAIYKSSLLEPDQCLITAYQTVVQSASKPVYEKVDTRRLNSKSSGVYELPPGVREEEDITAGTATITSDDPIAKSFANVSKQDVYEMLAEQHDQRVSARQDRFDLVAKIDEVGITEQEREAMIKQMSLYGLSSETVGQQVTAKNIGDAANLMRLIQEMIAQIKAVTDMMRRLGVINPQLADSTLIIRRSDAITPDTILSQMLRSNLSVAEVESWAKEHSIKNKEDLLKLIPDMEKVPVVDQPPQGALAFFKTLFGRRKPAAPISGNTAEG